ncbi:hypothetical protein LTR13_009415 [Exophiala sideris]|nr:hypothetical protein LTR13_009415 [Exophiala sideris]KAK5177999.1 hypothetical protein LTR44_009548 [Eurotiomycetes sp. CCFEE 6388]
MRFSVNSLVLLALVPFTQVIAAPQGSYADYGAMESMPMFLLLGTGITQGTAIDLLTTADRTPSEYGSYGDYGAYKRDEVETPEKRDPEPEPAAEAHPEPEAEAEAEPAPADYGNYGQYGKYGNYGAYKDIEPAGEGNPYGSYGNYGSYKE